MQNTAGNRCRPALIALCIAVLLVILPCAAGRADYYVLPNGTAYTASLELIDASGYEFYDTGLFGDMVPLKVRDVTLSGDCSPCTFSWKGENKILFPNGNYTLSFQAPLSDNHFIAVYDRPSRVKVIIPPDFDVRNPALGMVSSGGIITDLPGGATEISWNATRIAEVRFYERGREELLYLFVNFWVIIAIVMLVPFLITRRKNNKLP